MFAEAVEVRDRLASLVDRLDPDAFSGPTARELWGVFDSAERLCAAGKTLLARRVAATHQRNSGSRSAAEELARRGGTSTDAAKDSLNTSQRLPEQKPVEKALRRGELSPAQAAAISDAAAADPSQAQRLTELAGRVSLPELREECARVRAGADPDPEATNRRLHRNRRLRRWTDGEGFWNLHAKGSPQAGAAFNTVLDALTDQIFRRARRDGRREPLEAYAFDALMALADQVANPAAGQADSAEKPGGSGPQVASGDAGPADAHPGPIAGNDDGAVPDRADHGGDAAPTCDHRTPGPTDVDGGGGSGRNLPTAAPRSRQFNPRYLALLRVDVAALRRGRVAGDELCEIRGVGPVPVSVAEGLLGQAVLKLVITDGVDVLNVTHLGRGPTAAQRIALAWATPGCTVEGCWRTRTENDHREPWAQTRHTRLDELDPLCEFHHDLKTRLGWALVPGTGKRAFVPPEDPRHPRHQKPAPPNGEHAGQRSARNAGATEPKPPSRLPPSPARGPSRRRAAANAQTTLPDPPGDPPRAA